jgi:hypothetical protein
MEAPVNMMDCIVEPRYDTALIPVGGAAQLNFFQIPIGQGVSSFQPNAGVLAKTNRDTNMVLAGQLPGGYMFDLLGFRISPAWNISDNDMHFALNGALFTFVIGSKPFLTVPATCIPQGNGPFGSGASMNSMGNPVLKNSYSVGKKPLRLTQTQNFSCQLSWPGGVHATTTVNALGQPAPGIPITVYLDGYLYRPVQ